MITTLLMTVIMNLGMLQMDDQSMIEYIADIEEHYCD